MSTTAPGSVPSLSVRSCACTRTYNSVEWQALPLIGIQHLGERDKAECRNCLCGSTLLLPMGGKPTIRMSAVDERVLLDIEAAVGGRRS